MSAGPVWGWQAPPWPLAAVLPAGEPRNEHSAGAPALVGGVLGTLMRSVASQGAGNKLLNQVPDSGTQSPHILQAALRDDPEKSALLSGSACPKMFPKGPW